MIIWFKEKLMKNNKMLKKKLIKSLKDLNLPLLRLLQFKVSYYGRNNLISSIKSKLKRKNRLK
jgi:hypothetical protein